MTNYSQLHWREKYNFFTTRIQFIDAKKHIIPSRNVKKKNETTTIVEFSCWLISIPSETRLYQIHREHRWDSLWFGRWLSLYWVGFQWPGFCCPVSSGDGIVLTEQWSEAQIQNERGVTELWASSPCLLILLLYPAFLICCLQEMLLFDPWGLESVPLRVLIMFLLHPYRLGVQVAARLKADLRGRQGLPPHTLPGIWSYI